MTVNGPMTRSDRVALGTAVVSGLLAIALTSRPRVLQETGANGSRIAPRLRKSNRLRAQRPTEPNWRSPMKPQDARDPSSSADQRGPSRNAFGVMDSPIPTTRRCWSSPRGPSSREPRTMKMQRHGRPRATAIKTMRSKEVVQPVEWRSDDDTGRCREQMETRRSRSESRRRPSLPPIRLGQWVRRGLIDAHRKGRAWWEVYHSDHPKVTRLVRLDREQSKDRRALDGGRWISVDKPSRRNLIVTTGSPLILALAI